MPPGAGTVKYAALSRPRLLWPASSPINKHQLITRRETDLTRTVTALLRQHPRVYLYISTRSVFSCFTSSSWRQPQTLSKEWFIYIYRNVLKLFSSAVAEISLEVMWSKEKMPLAPSHISTISSVQKTGGWQICSVKRFFLKKYLYLCSVMFQKYKASISLNCWKWYYEWWL